MVDDHVVGSSSQPSLKELEDASSIYVLPSDDVIGDVIIPSLSSADSVDCMMGYFTSNSFSEIAPGLANFINRSDKTMRLIVSPYLSAADKEALENGTKPADVLTKELLLDGIPDAGDLARHTLRCLTWLIREHRLVFKIALMPTGLFHPKVWLFDEGTYSAALHGSTNMTGSGLRKNVEQLGLARSWMDPTQAETVSRLRDMFEEYWEKRQEDCIVIDLPTAVKEHFLKEYAPTGRPTEADFHKLWLQAKAENEINSPSEIPAIHKNVFEIPSYLDYTSGEYAHQGEAVEAWQNSRYRGVLEMATGTGKTITAMIGTHRLYKQSGPLLVVVAAPFVPLIAQWQSEIKEFGIDAVNLQIASNPKKRSKEISNAARQLRLALESVVVLLTSHDTLCSPEFQDAINKVSAKKLLIADEVHNLGRSEFISNPPDFFDYRLGLSATPVRQYDEIGTLGLFEFFGPICYSLSLNESIGKCLVEYDYYIHRVELTPDEMDDWRVLSAQIKKIAWKLGEDPGDSFISKLLRDRRLILETAAGKVGVLANLLDDHDLRSLKHTLIYGTDKDPDQLQQVNSLLKSRNIIFHQLTQTETSDKKRTSKIIESFQNGRIQVLTAKRVLDEGINIPQIERAYILASTTVERQWVQRRGRLLRTCAGIGKTHAEIHDFLTLPPSEEIIDSEARKIVLSELKRIREFAISARNAGEADGPLATIRDLVELGFPT